MSEPRPAPSPPTIKIVIAFLAVYLVWGSTYLAIRYAVETLPPFIMAGTRFLIAGAILYAWARRQGAPRPSANHWRATAIVGTLLLLGGNGGVVWAEKSVPSGLTALLVATVSLWMTLIDWLRPGGVKPTMKVIVGILLGLTGVFILVGPQQLAGGERVDPLGAAALMFASFSWAAGSVWSRHLSLPSSSLMSTGMQMLGGGVALMLFGTLVGDWRGLDLGHATLKSWLSIGYLIVFGSLVGFTAYTWLLKVTTPTRAATYAFVNPLVAVFLGWLLASEPLNLRVLLAAAVIVVGVVVITRGPRRSPASHEASRTREESDPDRQTVSPIAELARSTCTARE